MRILSAAVFCLLCGACAQPVLPDYQTLFVPESGTAPVGKTVLGNGWEYRQGIIEPRPTDDLTYLYTTETFADFILTVEFFPVGDVNSGIFIRCQSAQQISATSCYEINIWDDHPNQDHRTGSIVTRFLPMAKVSTVGKWNQAEIVAQGDLITVRMNNIITAIYENDLHADGFIALQRGNDATIQFRNIRLKQL